MPLFSQHRAPRVERAHPAYAPMPMPDPAGTAASQILRRYRPVETRAAGGFGTVEICVDKRLQRRVAIKRIPLADEVGLADPRSVAAAIQEAQTASMLQHPNIASVIDFSYDAAHAYLVMEYVDGMSLEEFLAQVEGGSVTFDECAAIADALAQALAYAHENRVLHLDIKPANVLIDRSGHVKLTDFGMASLSSAAGFGGARGGTIGYMPPEQLRGEEVDERTDVFALAALVYEALCGEAPFRAEDPMRSLELIGRGVEAPSELIPTMPALPEQALLAALDPDPARRCEDVTAFADRLLAGLGNPREGRKSLARLVAELTADEQDPDDDNAEAAAERSWELDPAEGRLGSRWPRSRERAAGVVGGLSVAWTLLLVLGALHVSNLPGRIVIAAAVGVAAGAAPQLGSALALTAVVAMVAASTPPLAAFVPITGICALFAGWWLTWGRAARGANAVLAAALAMSLAPGAPPLAAAPAAALAGYLLAPGTAAASVGLAVPLAALARAALAAGGALPLTAAAGAWTSASLWIAAAGLAASAAGLSRVLGLAWARDREGSGRAWRLTAYALPGLSALACGCLGILAGGMEIAGLTPWGLLAVAGPSALSSIIVWICAFALGYRHEPSEGGRS